MGKFGNVDWYCDQCNAYLNDQSGFTEDRGTWTCTECGYENSITANDIIWEGDESGDESGDNYDFYEDDDYDEVPEGCRACGGPYPDCMTSCNLFDD